MALSDRDIVITPNKGQTDDPKIVFSGANANVSAQTITLRVYPDNAGTLSFEGSAGQLFSITNDLTGTLFSVNDSSGIPSLEVNADGTVTLAEFSGNVGIGTGTPLDKLHVEGTLRTTQVSVGNGTVSSPSFEFYNDPDTGIYLSDSNTLSFVTNGTIASSFTSTGDLRLYNTAGTFYSQFSNQPTANRTLTIPDVGGTFAIIQSAATAGYFDTSTTTPTGTTRLNYGGYIYPTALNLVGTGDTTTTATHYFVETGTDGFVRPKTLANVQSEIVTTNTVSPAIAGAGVLVVNALSSNVYGKFSQNVSVLSTNASTSTTTGAFILSGGAGIAGNVNVGGTRNLFTGSVGVGTSAVLGATANILSVYGTAMVYGNIDLGNPTGGTSGIYFNDGTYQTTAFVGAATPSFGAAGTVQYAGAGNTFSGNTANFFWDDTNSRLGIGTQTPQTRLSVGARVTDDGSNVYDTNSLYVVHQTPTSSTVLNDSKEVLLLARQGTSGQAYGAAASFRISRYENNSVNSRTRLDLTLAHGTFLLTPTTVLTALSNGSIGIGTTAPTNILTVVSTATPAWFNTINSAVSSNNYEILVGNSTNTGTTVGYVNNATVPYGYLSAGTTTRNIIIAANGRVGLGGTTVPQNILDVNGAVAIGTAYAGARTAPTNGLLVQGSVGIGTYTPLQPLDVRGNAYITGTHNLLTGKVGVGTSSALGASANVLSVYGTTMSFGNIDIGNTAAGGSGIYFPDGTFQTTAYVPTTYTTFTYTGNGSTTTYSTSPVTSSNINNTMVYVNGVYQRKETYGWSGTTITFDVAPPNFATIEIVVIQGINAPFGSVAGDISVNGNLTVSGGAIVASGSNTYVFNTVATGVYIGGNARDVQIGNSVGTTKFNSANASINTTTGAIVTPGGIGIGGNINVGGTRNLFTGSVGVGTSAVLGTTANVFSVYGTAMVYGNLDLGNPTGGTSGIYFSDGTYLTSANSSGTFSTKNANYTAVNGDKLLCDTSGGTFTITLPAAPTIGTTVTIYDKANFTAIPLTIARNGLTIEGLADDFSLDIGQTKSEIIYDGSTWHIYVSIGPRGLPGADASVSSSIAYSVALG